MSPSADILTAVAVVVPSTLISTAVAVVCSESTSSAGPPAARLVSMNIPLPASDCTVRAVAPVADV